MSCGILLLSCPLFANGVQENRIAQAKQLIAQKNYKDALTILVQVVREEPDRVDEAQDLIKQVRAIQDQFNDDTEKLIEVLYGQKDEEKALVLIAELSSLDKNPNTKTLEILRQAKRTAVLIKNNKTFNDIMARALAQLEKKQYAAAVTIYLEGSSLARDLFLEGEYGELLNSSVDRTWADLKEASLAYLQAESRLKPLASAGLQAITVGARPLESALPSLVGSMKSLAQLRQRAWQASQLFQTQNSLIQKSGRQEDFFLSYSYRLSAGRPESKVLEGIRGALDLMWSDLWSPWMDALRQSVDARFVQAQKAFDQTDYNLAQTQFEDLRSSLRSGLDLLALNNLEAYVSDDGSLEAGWLSRSSAVVPLGVWLEKRLVLAAQASRAAAELKTRTDLVARLDGLDRPGLEAGRSVLRSQKELFGGFSSRVGLEIRREALLASTGWTLLDPPAQGTSWQALWANWQKASLDQEAVFVDRRGKMDYGVLDSRFAELQKTLAGAQDQVEGKIKQPLEASRKLEDLDPLQKTLRSDISSFVGLYESEAPDVKTPAVLKWPVSGRELLGRLTQAQTRQGQLLATARTNYALSQSFKRQGQELTTQVLASIAAESADGFRKARDQLAKVSEQYSSSLALQEDAAFRTESDAQVKDLFDQIIKGENLLVVKEVRQFITQGSQAYLAGQFTQAQQILQRARARWATTNIDPNSEVEYWLNLAVFAQNINAGREVTPLDPLYNEVQQLLNFARADYEAAQGLIGSGKKSDSQGLLDKALGELNKITLSFPRNQEANLLKLQVLKLSNPEDFPNRFRDLYNAAVNLIGKDSLKAYTDLVDLQKIQPDYQGIAASIDSAAIDAGLKRRPPDPAKLAEARNLVALARRIYDANALAQFPTALVQVKKAIEDDPTNGDAQDLFDRISLRTPGSAVTMTPSQNQEFDEIQLLFTGNRTLEAASRLNEFKIKYPALRSDPKVKELERRIQAVS